MTRTSRAKIETARVVGVLLTVGGGAIAIVAGPNRSTAAERGRASQYAPWLAYALATWIATSGVGLALLRRWAGVLLVLPSAVLLTTYLVAVARQTTPLVFFMNVFVAAVLALPAAVAVWSWSVLGSQRIEVRT